MLHYFLLHATHGVTSLMAERYISYCSLALAWTVQVVAQQPPVKLPYSVQSPMHHT